MSILPLPLVLLFVFTVRGRGVVWSWFADSSVKGPAEDVDLISLSEVEGAAELLIWEFDSEAEEPSPASTFLLRVALVMVSLVLDVDVDADADVDEAVFEDLVLLVVVAFGTTEGFRVARFVLGTDAILEGGATSTMSRSESSSTAAATGSTSDSDSLSLALGVVPLDTVDFVTVFLEGFLAVSPVAEEAGAATIVLRVPLLALTGGAETSSTSASVSL